MTLKEATANSLLMFVAATCVVLIVKAISPVPHGPVAATVQDGVRVVYLHGNFRCTTCRTIEAFAKEAVESGFPEELADGRIEWQAINYEEPGNEQYAIEYEVVAPSVVLVKLKGGRQVDWKGLHEVWEHVGDKDAFLSFVQSNLREFMGASQAQVSTQAVPVFRDPIPEAPPLEPLIPDMPVPQMPASEAPVPEAAVPKSPDPDTASLETAKQALPLRSPAQLQRFHIANYETLRRSL